MIFYSAPHHHTNSGEERRGEREEMFPFIYIQCEEHCSTPVLRRERRGLTSTKLAHSEPSLPITLSWQHFRRSQCSGSAVQWPPSICAVLDRTWVKTRETSVPSLCQHSLLCSPSNFSLWLLSYLSPWCWLHYHNIARGRLLASAGGTEERREGGTRHQWVEKAVHQVV